MKLSTLLLLGYVSTADITDGNEVFVRDGNITYDIGLSCADCVMGGFNYCFKGKNGMPWSGPPEADKQACCKDPDGKDCKMNGAANSCTYDFGTGKDVRMYTLAACPQKIDLCGEAARQEIQIDAEGNSTKVEIVSLDQGQSCSYRMNVKCGSPYFRVSSFQSTKPNTTINVSWIEFDWSNKNTNKGTEKTGKEKSG